VVLLSVNFVEDVNCFTDQIGDPDIYDRVIGFYSNTDKKYYNLDEVRKLYDECKTSNVHEYEGRLRLSHKWLVYCCPVIVSCGIIENNVDSKYQSLVDYCYNHHICYESPKTINMLCGIKVLEYDSEGKKIVRYSINDIIYNQMCNSDRTYFRKIAQGKMNRLRYDYTKVHTNSSITKEYILSCDSVEVNDRDVIIYGISDKSFFSRSFIHALQELDLQVWMNRYHQINFNQLFYATLIEQANRGQYHKLKYIDERDSDIYWFNNPYEHER